MPRALNRGEQTTFLQKILTWLIFCCIAMAIFVVNPFAGAIMFIVFPVYLIIYFSGSKTKEDRDAEQKSEIFQRVWHPYRGYVVMCLFLWIVVNVIFVYQKLGTGYFLAVNGVILVVIAFAIKYGQERAVRALSEENMVAVAKERGFSFSVMEDISSVHEKLRWFGKDPTIQNVFSGTIGKYPLRVFDFGYTYMKKALYEALVLEIIGKRRFPCMTIVSKNDEFGGTIVFEKMFPGRLVDLEGNFSDFFSVYVQNGAEDDIRQLLTPDVMMLLIEEMKDLNFLFFDDKIYVVLPSSFSEILFKDEFLKQLTKIENLLKKWDTVF